MKFLKRLFYKILVWLHKQGIGSARFLVDHIFGAEGGGSAGDQFQKLVKYRQYEIPFNNPPRNPQITGDSIMHLGESYFEDIGFICTAIGGDTTESLYQRLEANVLPYLSTHMVIHIGGNDLSRGDTPEVVFDRLKKIVKKLKSRGVRHIALVEIMPLGNPATSVEPVLEDFRDLLHDVNFEQIPKLNRFYREYARIGEVDIIGVRHLMEGQDGWILPRYGLSDKIHVNSRAYREVYIPLVQEWAVRKGAL